MERNKHKRNRRKWVILPVLAVLCFFLTELLSMYPEITEKYYSGFFYPIIARFLSSVSAVFPYSLDDIFYALLLFIPFFLLLLKLLKKISLKTIGLLVINVLAGVYLLFYLLWGFNYFRLPVNQRLNLIEAETNKEEFRAVFESIIIRTNNSHCEERSMDYEEIDKQIELSYNNLTHTLKIPYPMGSRKDKQITFSSFYAKSGITGYFGPFFNEVHVNKKALPLEYPYILAHEKAHQLGITSEAEANFYSWLVCTQSESELVRYSGNLMVLYHFLLQAYELEEYKELVALINENVKVDIRMIRNHWRELRNKKMDKAASKVNNAYLKKNKVKDGIRDYRGVVKHVMNFSLDSSFQQKHNLISN